VVLVDADLRRPAVHGSLKLSKAPGLCDVIGKGSRVESVVRPWPGDEWLKVLTVGTQPPNITEVVGSNRISAILSELKTNHELVIVDSPPLIIADAYNLASRVDGVIVVLEPGQTTNEQAKALHEQLTRSNARILGFVFNKVTEESIHSYGDYQYRSLYSPKYYSDYVSKPNKKHGADTRTRQWTDFFEHGKIPEGVSSRVESAFKAIRTKPKAVAGRAKKPKKADESTGSN
jgi:capsular exopolysaccharide synthesis family protein